MMMSYFQKGFFCYQPPAISHKLAEDWRLATED